MSDRVAWKALMLDAKRESGLSYEKLADAIAAVLDDGAGPDWQWVRWFVMGPPRPLSNPVWADAALRVLGVSWHDALNAMGATCGHETVEVTARSDRRLRIPVSRLDRHGVVWLLRQIERWRNR